MSEALADQLDLRVAWRRVKEDQRNDRSFVVHPVESILIESNLEGWLAEIDKAIRSKSYSPSPMAVCEVPKGRAAVRPGSILSLRDQVVYTALVGACADAIRSEADWKSPSPDFSYRINTGRNRVDWLQSRYIGWKNFREESLKRIREGTPWVVIADVVACYDNIAHRILVSDLRAVGVNAEVISTLTAQLSRWAYVQGRGIPQGISASDVLAKLYLTRIDQAISASGFEHYRYVDDFRLFCESQPAAKLAVIELSRILRSRGLNVQAAKTAIQRADQARAVIEGVSPVLKPLASRYITEIARAAGRHPDYISLREAEELLSNIEDDAPLSLLRRTYRTYFIDSGRDFNKTLFNYLLKRLGTARDSYAFAHSLTLLDRHPEITSTVLEYIGRIEQVLESEDALAEFVLSPHAVYAYQLYQVLSWRLRHALQPSESLIQAVRTLVKKGGLPSYLRSVARAFLGMFGSASDLDRLEQEYAEASSELERAELVCALSRLEVSRRNGFLGYAKNDGELPRRAVAVIQASGTAPRTK